MKVEETIPWWRAAPGQGPCCATAGAVAVTLLCSRGQMWVCHPCVTQASSSPGHGRFPKAPMGAGSGMGRAPAALHPTAAAGRRWEPQ